MFKIIKKLLDDWVHFYLESNARNMKNNDAYPQHVS